MYSYKFQAKFIKPVAFDPAILIPAVDTAQNEFNFLTRERFKHLTVNVNSIHQLLDFTLVSEVKLEPINFLRASQYFCKRLSLQAGMEGFVFMKRLLQKIFNCHR